MAGDSVEIQPGRRQGLRPLNPSRPYPSLACSIPKAVLEHRGGRVYYCPACDAYITADCECCEPRPCSCGARWPYPQEFRDAK